MSGSPPFSPVSCFRLDHTRTVRAGVPPAEEERPLLLKDERPTGIHVAPGTLAAQFACALGHLLFISAEGCEWESGAELLLLSPALVVLDAAFLIVPWTPGCLEEVRLVADDALDFRLAIPWRVRVRPRPRLFPQRHEWMGWPLSRPKDYGPLRRHLLFERRWRRGERRG